MISKHALKKMGQSLSVISLFDALHTCLLILLGMGVRDFSVQDVKPLHL